MKNYVVDNYELIDLDAMAAMPDDELAGLLYATVAKRDDMYKARRSTRFLEEEICYLKRELQLRKIRRERHDEYVKNEEISMEDAMFDERRLPSAELDNIQFVQAWNEWKGSST